MKKLSAVFISLVVLLCASCEQQVVSNDVPKGTGETTTVPGINDVTDSEADFVIDDVEDIDEDDSADDENVDEDESTDDETGDSDEEYEEDIEEPEYDYDAAVVAEKVKTLNGTADAIRGEIGAYLQTAANNGYGMLPGSEGSLITIYIEEGIWMVTVDNTDSFAYVEDEEEEIIMEWFGYGEADSSTSTADAEDADTLFAIALAKKFPEIQNGSAGAWVQDGSCLAAYYTEDTTAGDGQMDFLLGAGGWTESYCEWDTYNQGMSDEGNVVGTSPVLNIGGIEE